MSENPMTLESGAGEGLSGRAARAAYDALAGRRRGVLALTAFFGPAVIASIAYMDPGNFATNIQAGAKYGYGLMWVVVLANVIAMLFQALSAKLGIVTGKNLAELCRAHFPAPVVWAMWIVSEIAAMATDLAEFLGGAIGLSLLLGVPLLVGMVATGIVTYALLALDARGFRPLELVIGGLVAAIALCYLAEMFIVPVDWGSAAWHSISPNLADSGALTLAVGIVGATVMPHAIYLHSALTQARTPVDNERDRRALLRYSNIEVVAALSLAGLVNMAMVATAAGAFHAGSGRRRDRDRVSHVGPFVWNGGGRGVFDVADRVGNIELGRGNDGRSGRHAGVCRFPCSRLGSAPRDNGSRFCRCRAGRQCHRRAGLEPGCAESRVARADDRPAGFRRARRYHGRFRQRPFGARWIDRRRGCCARPERRVAAASVWRGYPRLAAGVARRAPYSAAIFMRARMLDRKTSMDMAASPDPKRQKVQPLQAGNPCASAPIL